MKKYVQCTGVCIMIFRMHGQVPMNICRKYLLFHQQWASTSCKRGRQNDDNALSMSLCLTQPSSHFQINVISFFLEIVILIASLPLHEIWWFSSEIIPRYCVLPSVSTNCKKSPLVLFRHSSWYFVARSFHRLTACPYEPTNWLSCILKVYFKKSQSVSAWPRVWKPYVGGQSDTLHF